MQIPPHTEGQASKGKELAAVSFSNSDYKFDKEGTELTKNKWEKIVLGQFSSLGILPDGYEQAIKSLAAILEQRDKTHKEFMDSGGKSAIEYTNKGGSTNLTKNPLLVLWDDLNKTALAYWRELGLTPSSYKKMTGSDNKKPDVKKGIEAALEGIPLDD